MNQVQSRFSQQFQLRDVEGDPAASRLKKWGSDLWADTCPPHSTASVVDRDSGKIQDPAGKAEGYREKQCAELARSVSLAFPLKSIKKSLFDTCSWRRICRDGRIATGTLV